MADNRSPKLIDLPRDIYQGAMPRAAVPDAEVTAIMNTLSKSCQTLHGLFKTELADRAIIKQLWQAVIDDKRETLVKLSQERPDLLSRLIIQPVPNSFIIESKCTFQKFDLQGETLLSAAVKRKQIKVIGTLLSCCNQLMQTFERKRAITAALSQWKFYDLLIIINAEGKEKTEIDIPKEYKDYAQSLIDVFKTETFPNGEPWTEGVPVNVMLSEKTESMLSSLLDRLAPREAMRLDEHIDAELLLLAIYKAYQNNYASFNNDWTKLDILCVRLMGLAQSGQIPETSEILCESLYDVVNAIEAKKEKVISPNTAAHKLKGGEAFYRDTRGSRVGLGFEFLCDLVGAPGRGVAGALQPCAAVGAAWVAGGFGKTMSSKDNKFSVSYAAIAATVRPSPKR